MWLLIYVDHVDIKVLFIALIILGFELVMSVL